MKICWNNIDNLILTTKGKFRTGNSRNNYIYFIEMPSCSTCDESYLMPTKRKSNYCSKTCSQKGILNSNFGKHLSKERKKQIGIESSKRNCGDGNPNYKGGVTKNNLPIFDTFINKLNFCENIRRYPNNNELLQVKCYKCNSWFTPSRSQVKNRVFAINNIGRENHFYCSSTCKNTCSVFNKVGSLNTNNNKLSSYELNIWSKEVLKRDNYKCIYCESKATHSHHIQPKKLEPFYALDPDNGVAVCKECHKNICHKNECSTGALAHVKC